jgi:enoyl-CoA hydratase
MALEFQQLIYERPAPHVARIVMNRPDKRNAQGIVMTVELEAALKHANHDPEVKVIILAGAGDHFSSGHDLSGTEPRAPSEAQSQGHWGDFDGPGWEGSYSREKELYYEITERWRNCPKPTIAEVQGSCIMGGNMLAWACDLIVCADDARFIDVCGDMAMPGLEWAGYAWELGPRKAKEWLFTGGALSAQDAERRGMVNHVVARAELSRFTLELAQRIAEKNRFALKLMKEAVNGVQDAAGRRQSMALAFALHQVGHMQNMLVSGLPIDVSKLAPAIQERMRARGVKTSQPDPA